MTVDANGLTQIIRAIVADQCRATPIAQILVRVYGPEHQRLKQTWVDSAKTLTTVYLSEPHFEKEVNSQTGLTEFKHYVKVGGDIVAIQTRRSNATEDVKYLIPDYLGSTSAVSESAGLIPGGVSICILATGIPFTSRCMHYRHYCETPRRNQPHIARAR